MTKGPRNEFGGHFNPLLKSMPSFDFFRQMDSKSLMPFEENSMIQHTSVNLDPMDPNSSFAQVASVNNLIPFASPSPEKLVDL